MKSIKKLFLIFLIVAFSLSLIGCNSNNEILNVNESNNIKISLVSSESQSNSDEVSYKVKVISDYITDDFYDWEVKWANPNSDWASKNVADYIEISLYGYYHDSALITCKQAFGCQVEIICYLSSNPNVKDTLVCDYLRRFAGVRYLIFGQLSYGTEKIPIKNINKIYSMTFTNNITISHYWGTGTKVSDDYSIKSFTICLNKDFFNKLKNVVNTSSSVTSVDNYFKYKVESSYNEFYYGNYLLNFIALTDLIDIKLGTHDKFKSLMASLGKDYDLGFIKFEFSNGNDSAFVEYDFILGDDF